MNLKKLARLSMGSNGVRNNCMSCACFDQCSACYIAGYDFYHGSVSPLKGGENSAGVSSSNRNGIGNEPK